MKKQDMHFNENMQLSRLTRYRIFALALLLALIAQTCAAQSAKSQPTENAPRVFSLPAATLEMLRHNTATGKAKDLAIDQLRKDADAALKQAPLSVMDKSVTPPSGDKHDYFSMAPYWWPDPSKPNGLPYIRRDGETNPEIEKVQDHKNFGHLVSTVHTLALAYYFFGNESYAEHATQFLRVWFLNPETRMNPNLQFAQGIMGINQGRGTGLIETRSLYRLVDAIGLLHGSRSWTAADQKGLEEWCGKFLDWMQNSPNGKDESAAKNNHGTYYDVQVVALALFLGKTELARSVLQNAEKKRIALQIEPDGRQPLELQRTKAFGYSTMNLSGLFELALLGENVSVDLWNFQTADGRSIHKALDYLVPFVSGQQKWPYPQIAEYNGNDISALLAVAAVEFKEPHYEELAIKIDSSVVLRIDVLPFLAIHHSPIVTSSQLKNDVDGIFRHSEIRGGLR